MSNGVETLALSVARLENIVATLKERVHQIGTFSGTLPGMKNEMVQLRQSISMTKSKEERHYDAIIARLDALEKVQTPYKSASDTPSQDLFEKIAHHVKSELGTQKKELKKCMDDLEKVKAGSSGPGSIRELEMGMMFTERSKRISEIERLEALIEYKVNCRLAFEDDMHRELKRLSDRIDNALGKTIQVMRDDMADLQISSLARHQLHPPSDTAPPRLDPGGHFNERPLPPHLSLIDRNDDLGGASSVGTKLSKRKIKGIISKQRREEMEELQTNVQRLNRQIWQLSPSEHIVNDNDHNDHFHRLFAPLSLDSKSSVATSLNEPSHSDITSLTPKSPVSPIVAVTTTTEQSAAVVGHLQADTSEGESGDTAEVQETAVTDLNVSLVDIDLRDEIDEPTGQLTETMIAANTTDLSDVKLDSDSDFLSANGPPSSALSLMLSHHVESYNRSLRIQGASSDPSEAVAGSAFNADGAERTELWISQSIPSPGAASHDGIATEGHSSTHPSIMDQTPLQTSDTSSRPTSATHQARLLDQQAVGRGSRQNSMSTNTSLGPDASASQIVFRDSSPYSDFDPSLFTPFAPSEPVHQVSDKSREDDGNDVVSSSRSVSTRITGTYREPRSIVSSDSSSDSSGPTRINPYRRSKAGEESSDDGNVSLPRARPNQISGDPSRPASPVSEVSSLHSCRAQLIEYAIEDMPAFDSSCNSCLRLVRHIARLAMLLRDISFDDELSLDRIIFDSSSEDEDEVSPREDILSGSSTEENESRPTKQRRIDMGTERTNIIKEFSSKPTEHPDGVDAVLDANWQPTNSK